MRLKPFSQEDWESFAGCESEMPFTADVKVITAKGKKLTVDSLVIVDGKTVQFMFHSSSGKDYGYVKEFDTPGSAYNYCIDLDDDFISESGLIADGFELEAQSGELDADDIFDTHFDVWEVYSTPYDEDNPGNTLFIAVEKELVIEWNSDEYSMKPATFLGNASNFIDITIRSRPSENK